MYDHICIDFLRKHAKMKDTPAYVRKITQILIQLNKTVETNKFELYQLLQNFWWQCIEIQASNEKCSQKLWLIIYLVWEKCSSVAELSETVFRLTLSGWGF